MTYRPLVMLDSGAYSVWTRGGEIDVDEYIEYCLEYADDIWLPIGLDVIPGSPGVPRTPKQTEEAARQTYLNNMRMREAGVENVVPVVHQGESMDWLRLYVEDGFQYIGLSPNKSLTVKDKLPWLDEVFSFLCGNGGFPPVRLHAFGETSRQVIFGYPWASVDSTSWVISGGMGMVLVPPNTMDGTRDWMAPPIAFPISNGLEGQKPSRLRKGTKAWEATGKERKQFFMDYFLEMGFSLEELQTDDMARKRLNIRYFMRVGEHFRHEPFRPSMGSGFLNNNGSGNLGVDFWQWKEGLDFVYVSGTTNSNLWMCFVEKCQHILLSFYEVQKSRAPTWEYVKDPEGFCRERYKGRVSFPGGGKRPRQRLLKVRERL